MLGTFTGKIISAIILALIVFLGSMAWVGMNSDVKAQVDANTRSIVKLEIKVNKIELDYRSDIKDIRKCLIEINKKIYYNEGLNANKDK